jgi:probable blue pigment (indigoidine) exporter
MPRTTLPRLALIPTAVPFPVLCLVAATACWGAGTVVTKQVLDDVDPLPLLAVQLGASCVFLALMHLGSLARVRGIRRTSSASNWRLTALGVLNPGLAYALGLLGLSRITASMSVLLWAAEPVLIIVFAVAVLREQVPLARAAALAVAVCGVVLVVYQPDANGDALGVLLTLGAVGACAMYTVLTRLLLLHDAAVGVVLAQQVAALLFAVTLAIGARLIPGQDWSLGSLDPTTWLAAAGSGILYYGLAFWLFLAGLRHVPATFAGAFIPLTPVFGVAVAYLADERLNGRQWAGAALVIGATAAVALHQLLREAADL